MKGGDDLQFVEPIKKPKQIEAIKHYLRNQRERNYILFVLGIHSGLRISDLLALRVEDLVGADRITLREAKTGKAKTFPIAVSIRSDLTAYLSELKTGWLFPSRHQGKPLGRKMAYIILNEAAKYAKIDQPIGTHSLRKTFAYWAYKRGTSLELIQKILNHSSPSTTLRYIGITQEQIDDVYKKLKFD